MKLLAGNSNEPLYNEIVKYIQLHFNDIEVESEISKFSDGECRVELHENLRGEDVFIIQSTSPPVNDNVMELLVMIDAVRRASARRITAIIPYFGYARQDRKLAPRVPITAKLIANILTGAGVDRILTVDIHSGQIEGFFDMPVDLLTAHPLFLDDIRNKFYDEIQDQSLIFISPDAGGIYRARAYGKKLNADIGIIDKRRSGPGESEVMNVVGRVRGKNCIVIDDICDSAGTLVNAAQALMDTGASSVNAYITHGIMSGPAKERIENSVLEEIVLTNTIQQQRYPKVRYRNIGPLIGQAIMNINNESSITKLMDEDMWNSIMDRHIGVSR